MEKKRPESHVTGSTAIDIIRSTLPSTRVIREITPDYGIDLSIELFDSVKSPAKMYETLGEFIYIQSKGTTVIEKKKIKVYPVLNVAKYAWIEDTKEYMEIEVVNYSIDTDLLDTVRMIGSSVCVLLFVVDTLTSDIFFICLNDVLDKYIQPRNAAYMKQETVTIPIPVMNKIDGSANSLMPLRLFGKSSKMYSAFNIIQYQLHELRHELYHPNMVDTSDIQSDESAVEKVNQHLRTFVLHFADQLQQLDIWSISHFVPALKMCEENLEQHILQLKSGKWTLKQRQVAQQLYKKRFHLNEASSYNQVLVESTIAVWEQLANMSRIYEEICREWFLPKFIGQLGSYPDSPEVIKT